MLNPNELHCATCGEAIELIEDKSESESVNNHYLNVCCHDGEALEKYKMNARMNRMFTKYSGALKGLKNK